MGLSATERAERTAALRPHHQPVFDSIGVPDAFFQCKSANVRPGPHNVPVGWYGFWDSDLIKDIYFEFTSFDCETLDQKRQLYVLRHNPNYKTLPEIYAFYDKEKNPTRTPLYYVDPKHFEKVNLVVKPTLKPLDINEFELEGSLEGEDKLYSALSMRDGICIALKVPHSSQDWINTLIRQSM